VACGSVDHARLDCAANSFGGANIENAKRIAESILGSIQWVDAVTGFLACPGKNLHSNPSSKRDCRIKLDTVPTVFCVHTSCNGIIGEKNRALRSEIGKANWKKHTAPLRWQATPAEVQRAKERETEAQLKARAEKSLRGIVESNACQPVDFIERSPFRFDSDGADDWRLLLRLYKPSDVLWIGALNESGRPKHTRNFRAVADWLNHTSAPGQHICPNPFKPGVCSRTAENIAVTRFLIVESDTLAKNDFCGILQWLQKFMRLRAIVDTAGKSLHGWFEFPSAPIFRDLKAVLPALMCDKTLFQKAHPCRLPGALREGRRQHLVYLDLGEGQ
jgi:hypothetical protein